MDQQHLDNRTEELKRNRRKKLLIIIVSAVIVAAVALTVIFVSVGSKKEEIVPTEAPTEAPTEPPTDPPTEAPTDPPPDYRNIFADFLEDVDFYYTHGKLIYLNDDDVPELILVNRPAASFPDEYTLCWINGEEVWYDDFVPYQVTGYTERSGVIKTITPHAWYEVWEQYLFDGSSFELLNWGGLDKRYDAEKNDVVSDYYLNDESAEEKAYRDAVLEYGRDWQEIENFIERADLAGYVRDY